MSESPLGPGPPGPLEAVGHLDARRAFRTRYWPIALLLLIMALVGGPAYFGDEVDSLYERVLVKPPRTLDQSGERLVPESAGGVSWSASFPSSGDASEPDKALTIRDVFGREARTLSYAGIALKLVGAREVHDCAKAVWGVRLSESLRRSRCDRVVSGLYQGNNARLGQISIIHVRDVVSGRDTLKLLSDDSSQGFVYSLQKPGAAEPLSMPGNIAFVHAIGHHVVVLWAQSTDPRERTKLLRSVDSVFDSAYAASRR